MSLHLKFRIIHASRLLVHVGFRELTVSRSRSYARPTMTRLTVLLIGALLFGGFIDAPGAPADSDRQADVIPAEDYALYDQVVASKFLTPATQLVVIERMTRFQLSPDREGPATVGAFQEQGYFENKLPADLIREFIAINRQPSRLERLFHFAVSYRFATEGRREEPEVSLPPYGWGLGAAGQASPQTSEPVLLAHARQIQTSSVLDRLAFSRVARGLRNDQALLYVEVLRPDGTGAGFLVWCRRQGRSWTLFDTEVAWTVQPQLEPEEGPLLAP